MRFGILKVRLDDDLRDQLKLHLKQAQEDVPGTTLSTLVRNVLREALRDQPGSALVTRDLGYREGVRAGYAAVQRAVNEALHSVFLKDQS